MKDVVIDYAINKNRKQCLPVNSAYACIFVPFSKQISHLI